MEKVTNLLTADKKFKINLGLLDTDLFAGVIICKVMVTVHFLALIKQIRLLINLLSFDLHHTIIQ